MKKPLTLRQLRIMLNGAKWSDFENGYLHRGGVRFSMHRGSFLGRLCYAVSTQDVFVVVQPAFTSFSKSLIKPLSIQRIHVKPQGMGFNKYLIDKIDLIDIEETADA